METFIITFLKINFALLYAFNLLEIEKIVTKKKKARKVPKSLLAVAR